MMVHTQRKKTNTKTGRHIYGYTQMKNTQIQLHQISPQQYFLKC